MTNNIWPNVACPLLKPGHVVQARRTGENTIHNFIVVASPSGNFFIDILSPYYSKSTLPFKQRDNFYGFEDSFPYEILFVWRSVKGYCKDNP